MAAKATIDLMKILIYMIKCRLIVWIDFEDIET